MFSLTFFSHSGFGVKQPNYRASPKIFILKVRTSFRNSLPNWRSILKRQTYFRWNGLCFKRKQYCHYWHLCFFREDLTDYPGSAHATQKKPYSVEANRPHFQITLWNLHLAVYINQILQNTPSSFLFKAKLLRLNYEEDIPST